jgi:hypothetical protein
MPDIPKVMANLRLRLETLNGWQRAWCISVLIWLLGCVAITGYNFPTEPAKVDTFMPSAPTFHGEYVLSGENLCGKWNPEKGSEDERRCQEIERELAPGGWYDEEKWHITRREEQAQEELNSAQLSIVERGIALWVVPSIGLYLLGMGISWTKRGFQKPS